MNKRVIREFLTSAESRAARKEVIESLLESVVDLRGGVHQLTLNETFAAYRFELQTYGRSAILKRLRQHARGHAGDVVDKYLQTLTEE